MSGQLYTFKTFGDTATNSEPVYIGIDQSYSGFGLTVMNLNGSFSTYVAKPKGTGIERLVNLERFILDVWREEFYRCPVEDVAMEGYAFGSQMANMLGELGGMVKKCVFTELGIRALTVPPTSLKKYVTGKGTGVQKNQILLHTYKKWDVEFHDDNAADSYALARIAAKLADTQYEKEILEKLDDLKFRA